MNVGFEFKNLRIVSFLVVDIGNVFFIDWNVWDILRKRLKKILSFKMLQKCYDDFLTSSDILTRT